MIPVNPALASLNVYDSPWGGLDRSQCLRLDLNECTLPVPERVVERIATFAREQGLQRYPAYTGFAERLAAYTGVPADHLFPTNGSDQGIDLLQRTLLQPGDEMLIATPEFPMFRRFAAINGIHLAGVPLGARFEFPYELFLNAITPATRFIVLINPNNPTGTMVPLDYIERVLRAQPRIPVLVDEAYFEYTGCTAIELLSKYENLIVLRTFSKGFAMAALRLGYIVARPELIQELRKVRAPFDVNSLAVVAATAQLERPQEALAHVREVMQESKPFIEDYFREHGIPFYPGTANFMLVAFPQRDELVKFLAARRILVRALGGPQLEGLVRMSLGTVAEMRRFADAVTEFLDGVR